MIFYFPIEEFGINYMLGMILSFFSIIKSNTKYTNQLIYCNIIILSPLEKQRLTWII